MTNDKEKQDSVLQERFKVKTSETMATVIREELFKQGSNFRILFQELIDTYADIPPGIVGVPQLLLDLGTARNQEHSTTEDSKLKEAFLTMLIEYLREYYEHQRMNQQTVAQIVGNVEDLVESHKGEVRDLIETSFIKIDRDIQENERKFPITVWLADLSNMKRQLTRFLTELLTVAHNQLDIIPTIMIGRLTVIIDEKVREVAERGHQAAITAFVMMHKHLLKELQDLDTQRQNIVITLNKKTTQPDNIISEGPDIAGLEGANEFPDTQSNLTD